ncbi:MAG: hypothetical protein H7X97_00095 [Opitutaceae bacterium]|nr:hypothetical protein [Verrucomicrobiales bacterium]
MKQSHNNAPNVGPQRLPVHFEFTHPTDFAVCVCVVGTFDHWKSGAKASLPAGGVRWWEETAATPGVYEHRHFVDGHWMPDPLATEFVTNSFERGNLILKVPALSEAAFSPNLNIHH